MIAARTLSVIAGHVPCVDGVARSDLRAGDWLLVSTRNSRYSILTLGDGCYYVTGGWFDQQGHSPATVGINGCTWGGRMIHTGLLAAPGLCLEFGNHVVTTRIRSVRVIRSAAPGCWN